MGEVKLLTNKRHLARYENGESFTAWSEDLRGEESDIDILVEYKYVHFNPFAGLYTIDKKSKVEVLER